MEEVFNFLGQLNQPLVLTIACVVAGGFIAIIVFDSVRRNRNRARSRSGARIFRRNIFRRAADTTRALRAELKRRRELKARRRGHRR